MNKKFYLLLFAVGLLPAVISCMPGSLDRSGSLVIEGQSGGRVTCGTFGIAGLVSGYGDDHYCFPKFPQE